MKGHWFWVVLLAVVGSCIALSAVAQDSSPVIAVYDGGQISVEDLETFWKLESAHNSALKSVSGTQRVLKSAEELAKRRILLEKAASANLASETNFQAWKQQAFENATLSQLSKEYVSDKVSVGDEQVKDYYDNNPEKFRTPETLSMRYIFLDKAKASMPDATNVLHAKIEKALAEIKEGSDFVQVATAYSETEGDKGEVRTSPVERIADSPEKTLLMSLEPDQVSPIIENTKGFQIFQLVAHDQPGSIPLEKEKGQVEKILKRTQEENLRNDLLTAIRQESKDIKVEYDEAAIKNLDASPESAVCSLSDGYSVTCKELKDQLSRSLAAGSKVVDSTRIHGILEKAFVFRHFCLKYAQKLGLDKDPEVLQASKYQEELRLASMASRLWLDEMTSKPTLADAQKYYDTHRNEYLEREKVNYESLEVPLPGPSKDSLSKQYQARQGVMTRARSLLQEARNSKPLKDLASQNPDLVYSPGSGFKEIVPDSSKDALDSFLATSNVGDLCLEPVPLDDRFVLFKILDIQDASFKPFETVKDKILAKLLQQAKASGDNQRNMTLLSDRKFVFKEELAAQVRLEP